MAVAEAQKGAYVPVAGIHVWEWFAELSAARGSSGFGPLPISFSEIAAWAALTGRSPAPWEVDLIRALDVVTMRRWATKQKNGGTYDARDGRAVAAAMRAAGVVREA